MASRTNRARVLVLGGGITQQIESAGGTAVHASYSDEASIAKVAEADALVLTGGVDIDPAIYGEQPHRNSQHPQRQRDHVELAAMKAAFAKGIPILGICRGSQLINAGFGGTLHQHLPDVQSAHRYHNGHDHRVKIKTGSRLARTIGRVERFWVVSIHHQAVKDVAPGFRVAARGLDGTIEAIETIDSKHWVLGVQFHPEISTNQITQRIFVELVKQAARRAGLPKPERHALPKMGVQFAPAGTAQKKAKTPRATPLPRQPQLVPSAYVCFRCTGGMKFDDRIDHIDHMYLLHGIDVTEWIEDDDLLEVLEGKRKS